MTVTANSYQWNGQWLQGKAAWYWKTTYQWWWRNTQHSSVIQKFFPISRSNINLFRVCLTAICKENHLNTMVSIYRNKRKPPYDTLFGVSSRLSKFGAIRCKIEGGVSIWSHFGHQFSRQPTTGLAATKHRHPEKAGTIIRASGEFHGHGWFCLWAMAILMLIFVWTKERKKSGNV